jgi:hypothetical protein
VKALEKALFKAAIGMDYMSESDYPLEVALAGNVPARAPTAAKVAVEFGFPAGSPVEEVKFDDWFDRLDSYLDPAPKAQFDALRAVLSTELTSLRVVRVGLQPRDSQGNLVGTIAVIVIGRDAWGDYVGVVTYSVET